MTVYFVRTSGSNSNNGTSPSTAWATIAHTLATLNAGDVAYVGAGIYREYALVPTNSGSSTAHSISFLTNASPIVVTCASHGFTNGQAVTITGVLGTTSANGGWRVTVIDANDFSLDGSVGNGAYTSGGNAYSSIGMFADVDGSRTGDAGQVRITTVNTESGGVAPSGQLIYCSAKNWWVWLGFFLDADNAAVVDSNTTGGAIGWTFRACGIVNWVPGQVAISVLSGGGAASNWFFDRCIVSSSANGSPPGITVSLPLTSVGTADYDCYVWFTNCLLYLNRSTGIVVGTPGSSGSFHGGGVRLLNNTIIGGEAALTVADNNISLSIPERVYNNHFQFSNTAMSAFTTGQIAEDYNVIQANTARVNVTAGTHSQAGAAYIDATVWEHEWVIGRRGRPHQMPGSASALLGFCQTVGTVIGGNIAAPSVDILGRPRPAGGGSTNIAAGAMERHDTGVLQNGVVHSTPGYAMQMTGPSDHDLYANLDAVATNVSIYVRYDTTAPTVTMKANPAMGFATDIPLTWTDPGANAWGVMSASVTPTSAGVATLRCAGVAGNTYFDDVNFV